MHKPMLVLAASATIAVSGLAAAPAGANGSHWSSQKCSAEYLKWYRKHFHHTAVLTPKQNKQANKYVVKLEKQHHCVIGG
jgi:hypothetical protein